MILHYLDARAIGGIETHVETLALAQCAAGEAAAVALHRDYEGSAVRARYERAGIEVHVAGSVAGFARLAARLRPSIVHTHGYKAGIVGRACARMLALPAVSTFHAGERGAGRLALYQKLDEWSSCLGGRIAVSGEIAARLPFAARVVRNFVTPATAMRPVPAQRRLVFAGRLSFEKGPDLFCRLAARNPSAGLWEMYGEGPMREELEAQHGAEVAFRGFSNSIRDVLGQATALVMTSRNEGLPMVALEAMAQGVPVVAPRTGGLPGLVEDGTTGFLFEPGDEAGLDAAIARLCAMDDDALAAMGARARETIARSFSPRAVLPELFRAYAEAGWRGDRATSTNVQSSAG